MWALSIRLTNPSNFCLCLHKNTCGLAFILQLMCRKIFHTSENKCVTLIPNGLFSMASHMPGGWIAPHSSPIFSSIMCYSLHISLYFWLINSTSILSSVSFCRHLHSEMTSPPFSPSSIILPHRHTSVSIYEMEDDWQAGNWKYLSPSFFPSA